MTATVADVTHITTILEPLSGGVVALVDRLLEFCREHDIEMHRTDAGVEVHPLVDDYELPTEDYFARPTTEWYRDRRHRQTLVTMPEVMNRLFRTVLARLAKLCDDHGPKSVSPYNGTGHIEFIGADGVPTLFRVAFMNSPSDNSLQIRRVNRPD
jgi:hypothetical protein